MPKTTPSSKIVAERFIKDQFAIMKKYGDEPKLSPARYRALLSATEKSFNSLRAAEDVEAANAATASEGGRGHSGNRPIKSPPVIPVRSKRDR
jgi:hypothetical protein